MDSKLLGDVDTGAAPLNASQDTSHVVPGGIPRPPKRVKAERFTSFYPRWIPISQASLMSELRPPFPINH